jgi:hypothetical protein
MKKVFLTIVFSMGLLLVGCQNSDFNPVSPSENQPALQKSSPMGVNNLVENIEQDASNALIKVTQLIDGNNGGIIRIDKNVRVNNRLVHVNAELNFGKNAFNGLLNITAIVNPHNASIVFLPHIRSFNGNVKLNMTITGVNLSKLNLDKSKPVYFAFFKNGVPVEKISNLGIGVDYKKGVLTVNSAELKHFSRYCWATRTGYSR